jgi:hypothetical protein
LTFSEIVELMISTSLQYGISILLSIVVVLICIPTKSVCFITSAPAFIVAIAFEFGHSNWSEMKSPCSVDLHLFYNQGCEHFFMYLLVICTSSFENSLVNSCAYFFIGMLILWSSNFLNFLQILDINPLSDE